MNSTKGMTVKLSTSDVLHIPGLGFYGLVGYSPLRWLKLDGLAIATEEYGAKFFANGAAPSGVFGASGNRLKNLGKSERLGSHNLVAVPIPIK